MAKIKTKVKSKDKPVPFFSVIIAVYNREKLIGRALDSLIAQTEQDWEAIIVDDGSTDRTCDTVLDYLMRYPQIRYIRQPHSGGAFAKNRGIIEAEGKFITFLDSDDEFDKDHLSSRKSMLIENPQVKFLHGGALILGNPYVPDRFNMRRRIDLRNCAIGGTFILDRETAIGLNGFSMAGIGADSNLLERITQSGVKTLKTSVPTYIYHHETDDSVTNRLMAGL